MSNKFDYKLIKTKLIAKAYMSNKFDYKLILFFVLETLFAFAMVGFFAFATTVQLSRFEHNVICSEFFRFGLFRVP